MSQLKLNYQSRASLITFVAILLGSFVFAFEMVKSFLLPILMGGILATLVWPALRFLKRKGIGLRKGAALITFATILLIVTPLLIFATLAVKQGISIAEYLSGPKGLSISKIIFYFTNWEPLTSLFESTQIEQYIRQSMGALAGSASRLIFDVAKDIPQGGLQIILVCLSCYFMLVDGRRFLRWVYTRLPLTSDVRLRVAEVFKETAVSVVLASIAASLAQALIMLVAFSVLNVPAAFLAGGMAFIFAFIPFVGTVPVYVSGIIYLFVQEHYIKMSVMFFFGIFTSTIDNFIRPWILKGRSEMHPFVSLISIFGGIEMFGLFGVVLGPIIAAVVISLLQIWPVIGRRYGMEFDNSLESLD